MCTCRLIAERPEIVALFDGEGDLQSTEFREHARRLMRSLQTEIQHLHGDCHDDSQEAVLTNTTPAIRAVCITTVY